MRGLILASMLLALCGCAAGPGSRAGEVPLLQLAPAALGRTMALQQRLVFIRQQQRDQIDALLEVDAHQVRLVMHQVGQSALKLRWDGSALVQSRAEWLPAALDGARVLADIQLVYWPAEQIQQALPAGWRLSAAPDQRQLHFGDELVVTVEYLGPRHQRLTHARYGYSLDIQSIEAGA